jgi:hypothetical protein
MSRAVVFPLLGTSPARGEPGRDFAIPMLDLAREDSLFTTVERRAGRLGHPSTVLLGDGRALPPGPRSGPQERRKMKPSPVSTA